MTDEEKILQQLALKKAVEIGDLEEIRSLAKEGALKDWNNEHEPILYDAAHLGDLDVLKLLIELGEDQSIGEESPLQIACINGHLHIVQYLVENGSEINVNDYEYGDGAPLKLAAGYGFIDIVQYLIDNGADIHAADDDALNFAIRHGNGDIVMLLLSLGSDPLKADQAPDYDADGKWVLYVSSMMTRDISNVYDYMLYLANEVYPAASESSKIDLLADIVTFSEMPFIKERIAEEEKKIQQNEDIQSQRMRI